MGYTSKLTKKMIKSGSVHGLKYLSEERPTYEKIVWRLLIGSAFFGAGYCIYGLFTYYGNIFTKTTIVMTNHMNSNIPFPSITVCESSRIDWIKVMNLNYSDVMDGYEVNYCSGENVNISKTDFKILLSALSTAQFGSSRHLEQLRHVAQLSSLSKLNVDDLLRKLMRNCTEMFEKCWWRYSYFNCCEFFEIQRTGYGYCYSFNSDTSLQSETLSLDYGFKDDINQQWLDWNNHNRPRRSAAYGSWSGFKFTVNTQKIPDFVEARPGIYVVIGDPGEFPFENDLFIPSGKAGEVSIDTYAVKATAAVHRLPARNRLCLFPNERRVLGRGYLSQNCVADNYRQFIQQSCNCSLDFIFNFNPKGKKPCSVDNFDGIAEYNYIFNNHPTSDICIDEKCENRFVFCNCVGNCNNVKYTAELLTAYQAKKKNQVTIDSHFRSPFCVLYKTDVLFEFLEAILSVGNIAALFLGASLLTASEIVYFSLLQFWNYLFIRK